MYNDMYLPSYCHTDSFTVLNILCALSVHISLAQPLAPTNLFTVSIVLPFPECHMVVGIIQDVAFSSWFISLSSIQLRFLHVLSQLDNFFPALNNILLSGCTSLPTRPVKDIFATSEF